MRPRASVVIPVYNRAKSVLPTLQSVRDQTMADFECIVIDDGSVDGEQLREVVESLGDSRFRYLRRENGGGGAARNTGIDEAKGAFVAFLDSDDRWLPEKLAVQSDQLWRCPDRVVYCQCFVDRGVGKQWVRPRRGLPEGHDVGEYLFVSNEFIPTPTIALATDIARRNKWDPLLSKGQDLDFVLRLAGAGFKFQFWPAPLVIWQDIAEEGRTSHEAGIEHARQFLRKNGHLLTPKAKRGYNVTYLAYELAQKNPMKALAGLTVGAFSGVPLRIVARQLLRAFLPRPVYRRLVNAFVGVAGR